MNNNSKTVIGVLVVVVIAVVAYGALTMPDNRSFNEKIGDAVGKMDNGVDDAARELEDRTPTERIKDEVNDATDGSPE
jgi:hypothetical protein